MVILLDWTTLIKWTFSIISTGIAIYQYQDKKKYKNIVKSNSWMLFQRSNNLGGVVQKTFIEATSNDIDKYLHEKIVRSDALAGELLKEAFRLILITEEDVNEELIERWKQEGRITEDYSKLFKNYLVDASSNKKLFSR